MKRLSLLICLGLILLLVLSVLPAAAAIPKITGVSPSTAPNDGSFTLTISGSGFTGATVVRLNKCKLKTGGSSEPPFTGSFVVKGDSKIEATFDLTDKKVGDYDVSIYVPGETVNFGWGDGSGLFHIYSSTGAKPKTTTTVTGSETTAETTPGDSGEGDNSVFFDTSPSGATIFLDGDEIGTSPFTFHTDKDGAHLVLVKKTGCEDYSESINIIRNQRVYFFKSLTQFANATNPSATGPSGKTTTMPRNTLRIPTPLGTFEAPPEEAPLSPATILWAVAAVAVFIVLRRR